MRIINIILGLCGYVRIPLSVIQLSMQQEALFERLITACGPDKSIIWESHLKGQKAITEFLRAGRKITYRKSR